MKKFLTIILFILIGVIYLSNTSVLTMAIWHRIFKPNDLHETILYKKINKIKDIEGVYKFSNCKYTPEYYEIGIEFEDNTLPVWHKSKLEQSYYIKSKILIRDQDNIIFSKNTNDIQGGYYSSPNYLRTQIIESFEILDCKNLTLEINFIDTNVELEKEKPMHLYVKVYTLP